MVLNKRPVVGEGLVRLVRDALGVSVPPRLLSRAKMLIKVDMMKKYTAFFFNVFFTNNAAEQKLL